MVEHEDIRVIRIRIDRHQRGLFMATSPDISGLYLAHRDLNAILADIPNIVRLWFRRRYNLDVRVFQEAIPHEAHTIDVTALAMRPEIADACVRA